MQSRQRSRRMSCQAESSVPYLPQLVLLEQPLCGLGQTSLDLRTSGRHGGGTRNGRCQSTMR